MKQQRQILSSLIAKKLFLLQGKNSSCNNTILWERRGHEAALWERPWGGGGHQDGHQSMVFAGRKGSQQPPGLYEPWHSVQVERMAVQRFSDNIQIVHLTFLIFFQEGRHGQTEGSSAKAHWCGGGWSSDHLTREWSSWAVSAWRKDIFNARNRPHRGLKTILGWRQAGDRRQGKKKQVYIVTREFQTGYKKKLLYCEDIRLL